MNHAALSFRVFRALLLRLADWLEAAFDLARVLGALWLLALLIRWGLACL